MKKALWISRHTMTPDQLSDLERVLNDSVEVAQFTETVKNTNDLKPFVDDADVICAVLPIDKLAELMDICGGKPVLQAKSKRVPTGKEVVSPNGTKEKEFAFVHDGWRRMLEVKIRYEDL